MNRSTNSESSSDNNNSSKAYQELCLFCLRQPLFLLSQKRRLAGLGAQGRGNSWILHDTRAAKLVKLLHKALKLPAELLLPLLAADKIAVAWALGLFSAQSASNRMEASSGRLAREGKMDVYRSARLRLEPDERSRLEGGAPASWKTWLVHVNKRHKSRNKTDQQSIVQQSRALERHSSSSPWLRIRRFLFFSALESCELAKLPISS